MSSIKDQKKEQQPGTTRDMEAPMILDNITERAIYRRAVEAAIWGMPIVSVDAMKQAFLRDAGAQYNDIVYLSLQSNWKFQVTTPNASTWYVYIQVYLKNGPLVLDIPQAVGAGLFGSLSDAWQTPQIDVGNEGEDKGIGARYLILPPGYTQPVPQGYIAIRFPAFNGYSLLRSIPSTTAPADVARALDLVKKIRIYSLTDTLAPPQQKHIDIAGKLFDGIVRYDDTFYDSLARILEEEPVLPRDLAMMAQLRTLGIEKGKPFKPTTSIRKILKHAISEAHAGFMQASTKVTGFWERSHWGLPDAEVSPATQFSFETDSCLRYDERATIFFLGFAPPKKLGSASFYLLGGRDVKGIELDGSKNYELLIPPNVPVRQFWAVTVYDLRTAGFIKDAPRTELNSYQQIQKNADGSVTVFFGPTSPKGKKSNWIYTAPGIPWFTIFRFYGPEKALFDKTWKLEEIEEK